MNVTDFMRKRFLKDYSIPCNIWNNEELFLERLDFLDKWYGCKKAYKDLENMLKDFDSEKNFIEYYEEVKNKAIACIKESEGFKRFNEDKEIQNFDKIEGITKKDIYNKNFVNFSYMSIDLVQANFQALKMYSDDIFKGFNKYEDFIKQFTDYAYIINSKYIRQVVFGNCNPRRQIKYMESIMTDIYKNLLKSCVMNNLELVSLNHDELIFRIKDSSSTLNLCQTVAIELSNFSEFILAVSVFDLESMPISGYVKVGEKNIFKCLNPDTAVLDVKRYLNMDITENDMIFNKDGSLCKYLAVPNRKY